MFAYRRHHRQEPDGDRGQEDQKQAAVLEGGCRVVENLQFAFAVFISGDVKIARRLIGEKTQLRTAELAAAESHLARLRQGRPESIETSALHIDVLRDLKRIHSHICSAAYPVLDAAGELQPSRLKQRESSDPLLPRLDDGQPRLLS
jgi:Na+/phosphate symporter